MIDVPLNPFELSVKDGLERRGIPVTPQYGVSGYRIDFACAHPDEPGRMVLAVEADGASYHSVPTARDRDRLRQQVLESKGWRFHRIWSTAWAREPRSGNSTKLNNLGNRRSTRRTRTNYHPQLPHRQGQPKMATLHHNVVRIPEFPPEVGMVTTI